MTGEAKRHKKTPTKVGRGSFQAEKLILKEISTASAQVDTGDRSYFSDFI